MAARSTTIRRGVFAALATPMALGAVAAGASTAQAHDDVRTSESWRQTSECWCEVWDEHDGTYFSHDAGGRGYVGRMYYPGNDMVGKVEFHPKDEKVWVYDTKANNDAIYVRVTWGDEVESIKVPSGDRYTVSDLDIPEGTEVEIKVYDEYWGYGLMMSDTATA